MTYNSLKMAPKAAVARMLFNHRRFDGLLLVTPIAVEICPEQVRGLLVISPLMPQIVDGSEDQHEN